MTVISALILGISISIVLIGLDYLRTLDEIQNTGNELGRSTRSAAMQAAYTLDPALARQVLTGLLEVKLITSGSILDENGTALATLSQDSTSEKHLLDCCLFDNDVPFVQPLVHTDPFTGNTLSVGQLLFSINGEKASAAFLQRSLNELMFGIIRNTLLAILILVISQRLITRPLSQIAHSILDLGSKTMRVTPPKGHEDDEIGIVSNTVNALLKQVETQSRELQLIIEAIPDAIVFKDSEGHWLYVNEAATRVFGLNGLDWKGKKTTDLFPSSPQIRHLKLLSDEEDKETWQRGSLSVFHSNHVDGNGNKRYFEIRKIPAYDTTSGKPLRLILIARDITEQRKTETKLRISATAFESLSGIVVTDPQGIVLQVNSSFCEMTGYKQREIIGCGLQILKSEKHSSDFYKKLWRRLIQQQSWEGEIWNKRKNGEDYPQWLSISPVTNSEGKVTHYVGTAVDITAKKNAEKQIINLAFYDHLTQLANRRLIMERIHQALTRNDSFHQQGAVIMIDLDNFKVVNDVHGHTVGDQLLQQAAKRLKDCVHSHNTVARLGGDEFVILIEPIDGKYSKEAFFQKLCNKIMTVLSQPYYLDVGTHSSHAVLRSYHCTSSIGIALFGSHQASADELLRWADTAMYQAKVNGKNSICFFNKEMQRSVEKRASLEVDLRNALHTNKLEVYYQPQLTHEGKVLGAEALLRWNHPDQGFIAPVEFIQLAEETGLILPLGQWVLECACKQLSEWSDAPKLRDLSISVNVSPMQITQDSFVENILNTLKKYQVDATNLKLELTESLLLNRIDTVILKMKELREYGVGFSLDDFGTGYSCLSYLKRLPLDQLKIDQSFVHDLLVDPSDLAIVQTIIALGKTLDISVIAEGVETKEHCEFLYKLGCPHYQGCYFSHPIPADALKTYIIENCSPQETGKC